MGASLAFSEPWVILLLDPARRKALRPLLWPHGREPKVLGMAIKWVGRVPGSLGSGEGRRRRKRQPQPRPHRGHVGTSGKLLEGLIWPSREMHSSSGSRSCRMTSVTGQLPHPGPARVWPTAETKPMPATARGGWREGQDGVHGPPRVQKKQPVHSSPRAATPAPPQAHPPASPDQSEELLL